MRVRISEDFRVAYKKLKKRHKSLEADFERLLSSLLQEPIQGVELEGGARKVRLAVSSKGRGKSGGARVIIRVRLIADELQLLYIYDKADFENVSDAYLRDIMKRMEQS
ncbi:MAG: type II toxin-antitoxin system RelE/ParE family toxin [Bacteroidaceae bacterium]|nr:type II toxin-antitoxin system RelE/ParE family toxin [Bacteroidaceae bacterium]